MPVNFSYPIGVERRYAAALRRVGRVVAGIISAHTHGATITDPAKLDAALAAYASTLAPWAQRLATSMVAEVAKRNQNAFLASAKRNGLSLRGMLDDSLMGDVAKLLHARQVQLITSIPIEAGTRAQRLAQEAAIGGERAAEVAKEIARTQEITLNRATLIARTEIAKANAAITQARSQFVGATHYIWETAEDGDVRQSHKQVQGKVFEFNNPPTLSDGMRGNPGEFPNCRCFAIPVLKD